MRVRALWYLLLVVQLLYGFVSRSKDFTEKFFFFVGCLVLLGRVRRARLALNPMPGPAGDGLSMMGHRVVPLKHWVRCNTLLCRVALDRAPHMLESLVQLRVVRICGWRCWKWLVND